MSQGKLRFAMDSFVSPLTLPNSDNILLDNGVGNQGAHGPSAPFSPDCLLSPVTPSIWKSASPQACFGIDTGGTLCKVVFFEPMDGLDATSLLRSSYTSLTVDSIPSEPALQANDKAGYNSASTTIASEECCCSSKLFGFQGPQESRKQLSMKRQLSTSDGSGFENQEQCTNNIEAEDVKQSTSSINKTVLGTDGIGHTIADCNKEFSKPWKTGLRLWVSSHDPVVLQGRGTLFFKCFETWRMEEFLYLTREHSLVTCQRAIGATGGGAKKFGSQFLEIANLRLSHFDELKSLVQGIDFLMKYSPSESFEYPKGSFQKGSIQRPLRSSENNSHDSDESLLGGETSNSVCQTPKQRPSWDQESSNARGSNVGDWLCQSEGWHEARKLYPYLVVNIGSGVSILLVESPEQFKRVGGTSLGGSTFLGLVSALTGCTSFKEAIDLAAEGDSTQIDMLVGDIYGGDYSEMGLAATTVASSFGKLVQPARRDGAMKTPQHLAKATLLMITNNIGSLAKLHAQATGVEHVLFTGSFMQGNKLAMRLLAAAMEFWSKGQIKAMFLRHGGHAGAMGALLNAIYPSSQTDASQLS